MNKGRTGSIRSSEPLHERVAQTLSITYIEAGHTYLPSISSLAHSLRVSSTTIGKALELLRSRGLLVYSRGKKVAVAGRIPRRGPLPESSLEKLTRDLRASILGGSFRAGQVLPKFEYFVRTRRVSRDTVAEAYRNIRGERLIHKQGRSWLVGPGPQSTRAATEPRPSTGAPVILVFTADFFQWSSMCIAERYRPFTDNLYHELEHYGVQTRIVLPRKGLSGGIFPSGHDQIRELITSLDSRYMGTLLACKRSEVDDLKAWIGWFAHFRKPVVWLDANDEGADLDRQGAGDLKSYFRCRFDEQAGVSLAVKTLIDLGHQEIGIPNFRTEYREWVERRIELVRKECELAPSPPRVVPNNCPVAPTECSIRSGASAAPFEPVEMDRFRRVIQLRGSYLTFIKFPLEHCRLVLQPLLERQGLTAIIAPNDFLSVEYYFWLTEQGVAIPGDLSLLSFDNYEETRPFPISTIDFGFGHLGYCAAHLFMNDIPIRAGRSGTVDGKCSLIDRGSVGPPSRMSS